MKYFSMFSGIGGFELGIIKAIQQESIREGSIGSSIQRPGDISINNVWWRKSKPQKGYRVLDGLCIGFSEIDKYAIQIYEKHFKGHKNYGDCSKIKWREVEDFDLLVGGFPCQAFSIAGKRGGFDDTRGTLFFEIARCIREKQPRLFLLENVKGLLSHDNGATFFTILTTLDELGYDCQWQVLNSKNFGVPQNRERVFIIGHLRGTSRPEVFPIGEKNRNDTRRLGEQVSMCLDANYFKGVGPKGYQSSKRQLIQKISGSQGMRVYDKEGISTTIAGQAGGWGAKTGLYQIDDIKIRRLTPTECERLQGFPDGWTEGISDTQRYKCLGNAVTVNVIEAIFKQGQLNEK